MNKQIQEMPKVVLHVHLDGSLRPETVKEWIDELLGKEADLEEVRNMLMVEKDCRDLNQYLKKFDLPVKVLQTAEHLDRVTYELYEDLAKQNVKYAEVRFAPCLHTKGGLSYDEIVEATIHGMERAKREFDIDGNLILCCMRGNDNKEVNLETVNVAERYLGKGVCAIDLAGAEALFKTSDFEDIFKVAEENGVPFTIHAGEADGPKSVIDALRFGAKRIGHGVRSVQNPRLVKYLSVNKIPLEVCPISELQTQAVKGKIPVEELYKCGVPVTINTDNNTVSNTSILEEYEWVLDNTSLTEEDLVEMNLNAAKSIFAPEKKREKVVAKIEAYRDRQKGFSIDD